jgi:hypothetical protein
MNELHQICVRAPLQCLFTPDSPVLGILDAGRRGQLEHISYV